MMSSFRPGGGITNRLCPSNCSSSPDPRPFCSAETEGFGRAKPEDSNQFAKWKMAEHGEFLDELFDDLPAKVLICCIELQGKP